MGDHSQPINGHYHQPYRQVPIVCPGHSRPLAGLDFSAHTEDGLYLISAAHDREPMLRSGETGNWIGTFKGHKGAVWSSKLNPDATFALTASGDFSAKIWDAVTGSELHSFPHGHVVKTVEFAPDSRSFISGGQEVRQFEWQYSGTIAFPHLNPASVQSREHAELLSDLRSTLPYYPKGILRLYDLLEPDAEPSTISLAPARISRLVWDRRDTRRIYSGTSDGKVRAWDLRSKTETHTADLKDGIMDLEASARGELLTSSQGSQVSFLDSSTLSTVKSHKMPMNFLEEGGASLHPTGTRFIAGGSDLAVRVFDFDSGQELECNKGHHGPVRCIRYAPEGRSYATGSEDGTIRLWQTDLNLSPTDDAEKRPEEQSR